MAKKILIIRHTKATLARINKFKKPQGEPNPQPPLTARSSIERPITERSLPPRSLTERSLPGRKLTARPPLSQSSLVIQPRTSNSVPTVPPKKRNAPIIIQTKSTIGRANRFKAPEQPPQRSQSTNNRGMRPRIIQADKIPVTSQLLPKMSSLRLNLSVGSNLSVGTENSEVKSQSKRSKEPIKVRQNRSSIVRANRLNSTEEQARATRNARRGSQSQRSRRQRSPSPEDEQVVTVSPRLTRSLTYDKLPSRRAGNKIIEEALRRLQEPEALPDTPREEKTPNSEEGVPDTPREEEAINNKEDKMSIQEDQQAVPDTPREEEVPNSEEDTMAIQEDQEAVPDAPREEEVPNSEEGREEEAITEKYLVRRYTEYQETFPYTEREGDGPSISDFFATITESEREKIESFLRRIQLSQWEEAVPDASEEEPPNSEDDTDLIVIDLNEHRLHNRNPVTTPDANNAVSKLSDSDDKRNCPKNDDNCELLCGESSVERNCSKEADNFFCESSTSEVTEEEFSKKKNDDNSSNSSP